MAGTRRFEVKTANLSFCPFPHLAPLAGQVERSSLFLIPPPLVGRVGRSEAEAGVGDMRMCSAHWDPHPTHRIAALTMRHPPHEDGGGMKSRDPDTPPPSR